MHHHHRGQLPRSDSYSHKKNELSTRRQLPLSLQNIKIITMITMGMQSSGDDDDGDELKISLYIYECMMFIMIVNCDYKESRDDYRHPKKSPEGGRIRKIKSRARTPHGMEQSKR